MNMPLRENRFDAIIVGSGTAGATLARELARQNKRVLILERGNNMPLQENFWGMVNIANEVSVGNKLASARAITTGGSTALYAAIAELPQLDSFLSLGIDLSQALEEVQRELPLAVLPDHLLGDQALKLRDSAVNLGYPWKKNIMLVDQSKCTHGYSYEAKWKAKSYVQEALDLGATLLNQATVVKVLVENNRAIGVEYKVPRKVRGFDIHRVYGEKIVVAAGVLATPTILRESGIKNVANRGFYCSPGFLMFGYVENLRSKDNFVGCMSADLEDDIVVGDANLPKSFYKLIMLATLKLPRYFSYSRSMAVGCMVKDGLGGELSDGRYHKQLSKDENRKLKKGEDIVIKILKNAGAKHIFRSATDAGNVGGVVRIQEHLSERLETEYSNLYVCDGSIVPEHVRLHPTVTLVCLAKYLAKHLFPVI